MKVILLTIFASLLFAASSFAQLVVTPYVVMIDKQNKFGTYMVLNETDEEQEVSISFKFGYPVSDAEGNVTMLYDSTDSDAHSLTQKIKAFPRKFILKPKEKQIIRMTVSPEGLAPGTYWTRIVTSSQSRKPYKETNEDFSANINFVLHQITTVLYKNGDFANNVEFTDLSVTTDSAFVNLIPAVKSTGTPPFFCKFTYKIYDSSNKAVIDNFEYIAVYYDLKKKISIPLSSLTPGSYTAEVTVSSDDSPDIPKSDKGPVTPLVKKVGFTVQ
jgi:hypothetical protein